MDNTNHHRAGFLQNPVVSILSLIVAAISIIGLIYVFNNSKNNDENIDDKKGWCKCPPKIKKNTEAHILDMRYANQLRKKAISDKLTGDDALSFSFIQIDDVIKDSKCTGVRFHYGMEGPNLVLVMTGAMDEGSPNPIQHTDILAPAYKSDHQDALGSGEGHDLTLAFQNTSNTQYPNTTKSGFFPKDAIMDVRRSEGIRVYIFLNSHNQLDLLIYGAIRNGSGEIVDDDLGIAIDMSVPCPTDCGAKNDLNNSR